MPAKTDLTCQELLDQLPASSLVLSDGATALAAGVYLDVGTVIGSAVDALTDEGVVELLYRLLTAAYAAQVEANTLLGAGERLDAFSAAQFGAPQIDEANSTLRTTVVNTMRSIINSDYSAGAIIGPNR